MPNHATSQLHPVELGTLRSTSNNTTRSDISRSAGDEHQFDTAGMDEQYDSSDDTAKPDSKIYTEELNRRTVQKLDFILLPFLALLFLFNSLDRSNVRP
jgi:hypothetical protein